MNTSKIAPFRMSTSKTKAGFTLAFEARSAKTGRIERVALQFPAWWKAEIERKLAAV